MEKPILILGPQGSGKTTLLKILTASSLDPILTYDDVSRSMLDGLLKSALAFNNRWLR